MGCKIEIFAILLVVGLFELGFVIMDIEILMHS
jgi:hypothetical protein